MRRHARPIAENPSRRYSPNGRPVPSRRNFSCEVGAPGLVPETPDSPLRPGTRSSPAPHPARLAAPVSRRRRSPTSTRGNRLAHGRLPREHIRQHRTADKKDQEPVPLGIIRSLLEKRLATARFRSVYRRCVTARNIALLNSTISSGKSGATPACRKSSLGDTFPKAASFGRTSAPDDFKLRSPYDRRRRCRLPLAGRRRSRRLTQRRTPTSPIRSRWSHVAQIAPRRAAAHRRRANRLRRPGRRQVSRCREDVL